MLQYPRFAIKRKPHPRDSVPCYKTCISRNYLINHAGNTLGKKNSLEDGCYKYFERNIVRVQFQSDILSYTCRLSLRLPTR